jgi:putative FmdB family regulatory protein
MPFYEYECQSCKYYAEVMQKITDAPLRKCPACGRMTLRKLVSAPAFRLKGGGWYETDFKSEKESKRNLAGAEADSRSPESPVAPAGAAAAAATAPESAPAGKAPEGAPAAKPAAPAAAAAPARKPARRTIRAPASRPKARAAKPAPKRRSRP